MRFVCFGFGFWLGCGCLACGFIVLVIGIWGLIAGVIMGLLVRVFDGVVCLGWVVVSFAGGSGCARWWICLVWLLSCLGLLRFVCGVLFDLVVSCVVRCSGCWLFSLRFVYGAGC